MRNKDKRKRRSKQTSPRPARNDYTIEKADLPTRRTSQYGLVETSDDYGFLNSTRNHSKGDVANEHSRVIKNERKPSSSRREQAAHYNSTQTPEHKPRSQHTSNRSTTRNDSQLEFYPQQIVERRSRSTSRTQRASENDSSVNRSSRPDRSRSKSRDILALYTGSVKPQRCRSMTPVGSLRSYIYVPPSTTDNDNAMTRPKSYASTNFDDDFRSITPNDSLPNDHYRRSRSLVRDQTDRDSTLKSTNSYNGRRARSETRTSLIARDAMSLCSNLSTQSRALSNSEIASQNLELWISTTSKIQRQNSLSRKKRQSESKTKCVTLLEMDAGVNEKIEKLLDNANSVKPADIKMMVIAGHTPAEGWESKDELKVKPGELITGLYKQNEWIYVSKSDSLSGYVPFAYTKAIKVMALDSQDTHVSHKKKSTDTNRSTQSLEMERSRHRQNQPEWANKESSRKTFARPNFVPDTSYYSWTSTPKPTDRHERDSLSSSNSAFLEEIMCVRPSGFPRHMRQPTEFADCLVVDADNKSDGLMEEDIRVCSDSGISEPNSNHSDEMDPYVSLANQQLPHYLHVAAPGSRSSLESTNPQEDCRARRMYKQFNRPFDSEQIVNQPHLAQQSFAQIDAMPFGVLGERLQRTHAVAPYTRALDFTDEQPIYCNITQDMRERAQSISITPTMVKPKIPKDYNGPRARVVYDYMGENADDVVVMAGDVITVLNSEDIEWIWVMRRDGVEGFMPKEFVVSTEFGRSRERNNIHHQLLVKL